MSRYIVIVLMLFASCERKRCYHCTYKARDYPDTVISVRSITFCDMTKSDMDETISTNRIPVQYPDSIIVYPDMACD